MATRRRVASGCRPGQRQRTAFEGTQVADLSGADGEVLHRRHPRPGQRHASRADASRREHRIGEPPLHRARPVSRLRLCSRSQGHLPHVPGTRNTRRREESGDAAIHTSLVAPETANADDYTLETIDASHFVIDERPDLVRGKLIALAEETSR